MGMIDRSPGFFDIDDRLVELSAKGDDLERVKSLVDFEMFRPALEVAVPRSDRSKGGRPSFDHVLMFKVLILQAMHALSDERAEFLIKDRLSFMRFLGLGLADSVPDANTIWTFREALKKAGAIDALFRRFDEALRSEGFLAMSGQIVDATIVAAPRQRNTIEEKTAIREGRVPDTWKDKPAKLAQKDRDARWTVKHTKARRREGGSKPAAHLAIPAFGYKNHVSIDRGFGLIRTFTTTHAAAHDGARLEDGSDEYGERRMGRHGLQVGEERGHAGAAWVRVAHPSQEAAGPGHAGAHAHRQCAEVESPQRPSSMCSRSRRARWDWSCGQSASRGPRSKSAWPIWSTTSAASSGSRQNTPPHNDTGRPSGRANAETGG
jgi:IS5 family transposase